MLLAVAGGSFWGGSGVAGQVLLQDCGFATDWLVTVRMLLAGVILLAIDAVQHKGDIWSVWRQPRNARELLTFAWAGMLIVQYSYFACIAYGNAAAAAAATPNRIALCFVGYWRYLPSGDAWEPGYSDDPVASADLGNRVGRVGSSLYAHTQAADPAVAGDACCWLGDVDWWTGTCCYCPAMGFSRQLDPNVVSDIFLCDPVWFGAGILVLSW